MKDYLGCKHVVAVNSGTAALHLALSLYEPQEVTVPALSFVSTAQAAILAGHTVKFRDINRKTLNIEPDGTGWLKIPVHFGGMPTYQGKTGFQ